MENPFDPDSYAYAKREAAFDALCSGDDVQALVNHAKALYACEAARLATIKEMRADLSSSDYDELLKEWAAGVDGMDGTQVWIIRAAIGRVIDVAAEDVPHHIDDFPTVERFLAAVSEPGAHRPPYRAPDTLPGGQLPSCMTPSHDRPASSFEDEVLTMMGICNAHTMRKIS